MSSFSSWFTRDIVHVDKENLRGKFFKSIIFFAAAPLNTLQSSEGEKKPTQPTQPNKKSTAMPVLQTSASFNQGKSVSTPSDLAGELPVLNSHSSSPKRQSGLSQIR